MGIKKIAVFSIFLICVLYGSFVNGILEIASVESIDKGKIDKTFGILNVYESIIKSHNVQNSPADLECLMAKLENIRYYISAGYHPEDLFVMATEDYEKVLKPEKDAIHPFHKSPLQSLVLVTMKYWSLKYAGMFVSIYVHHVQKEKEKKSEAEVGSTNEQNKNISLQFATYLAIFGLDNANDPMTDYLLYNLWGIDLPTNSPYGNIQKVKEWFDKLRLYVKRLVTLMISNVVDKQILVITYEKNNEKFEGIVKELDNFFGRIIYEMTDPVRPEAFSNRKQNLKDTVYETWNSMRNRAESNIVKIFLLVEYQYLSNLVTPPNCEYSPNIQDKLKTNPVDFAAKIDMKMITGPGKDMTFQLIKI